MAGCRNGVVRNDPGTDPGGSQCALSLMGDRINQNKNNKDLTDKNATALFLQTHPLFKFSI